MQSIDEQVKLFHEQGYLFLPECFDAEQVREMKDELPVLFAQDVPGRIMEKGTGIVRSVYGSHRTSEVFGRLVREPAVLDPARGIVDSDVYVHQFKINAKQAFGGEVWEWHQDYIFWRNGDGMPSNRVVNAVVFLDEVNEFNGPLLLIPGSHRLGVIDTGPRAEDDADDDEGKPAWASNVAAALTYSLTKEMIAELVNRHGIVGPKGPAGSVLFFDANIVHGSAPNMSPFDRALALITYNSVENVPTPVARPRPEFLASRDYTPVVSLAEELVEV